MFGFSLAGFAFAGSLPAGAGAVDKAKEAVWKIYNSKARGSGFFAGKKLFVTNFHVAEALLETGDRDEIVLEQALSLRTLKLKRLKSLSAIYDLALFETKEAVSEYLTIKENPPFPEEELYVLGYPEGNFVQLKKEGDIFFDRPELYYFAVRRLSLTGASGSPVVDKSGAAVGILFAKSGNILSVAGGGPLREFLRRARRDSCESAQNCFKEEMEKLKRQAQAGHPMAQAALGEALGLHREKAFFLGERWLARAARQGHSFAQYILGRNYVLGEEIPQNLFLARRWLRRSAERGYAPAQYILASLYYDGRGGERDLSLAWDFLKRSASQGYIFAETDVGGLLFKDKEFSLGRFWFERAASKGYAPAQRALALAYIYSEKESEKDLPLAKRWLVVAGETDPEALFVLAALFYGTEGFEPNEQLFKNLLERSAERGYKPAVSLLGELDRLHKGEKGLLDEGKCQSAFAGGF